MEKRKGIANYVVKYNSDPRLVTDNHKSNVLYLNDVDERNFDHICEALKFFSECISPITKIEELVPEVKLCENADNFQYILPRHLVECEEHVFVSNIDNEFQNSEESENL